MVVNGGILEVSPAKLKTLVAGTNVQLAVTAETLTLSSTSDVTAKILEDALKRPWPEKGTFRH